MAEITAALVGQLRRMTNAGLMDCKKALTATNGDLDAAAEVAELLNRLEAFAAFVRQQTKRWRQEVAEGFFV